MRMDQLEQEHLLDLCKRFRIALERSSDQTHQFQSFPDGCCRDTAVLLNEFLKEQGYEDIRYCAKDRDEYSSHARLEYKGRIIDLTADQFGQNYPPVLLSGFFYLIQGF